MHCIIRDVRLRKKDYFRVTIQVSCKMFCHEGSKFHKDTKKTLYFLLRAFVSSWFFTSLRRGTCIVTFS